jgi:hypothetical protein
MKFRKGSLILLIFTGILLIFPYIGFAISFDSTRIPDPGILILLGAGLLGAGLYVRRRKK